MTHEHWFDALNKVLVRGAPRRTLLGAAVTSLVQGAVPITAAKKGKKSKKGKNNREKKGRKKDKKRKRESPPRQCGPDVQAGCESGYHSPEDIQYCKDKCERCAAADVEFCIFHKPDDDHDDRHATCCPGDQMCCNFTECCVPDKCCETDSGLRCLAPGETCCSASRKGYCSQGHTCCPGLGCFRCPMGQVMDPVTCVCRQDCDESCAGPDLRCCDGVCIDVTTDEEHCGFCDAPPCTGPGKQCCKSACVDTRNNPYFCGGCDAPHCIEPGKQCCDGACIDILFDDAHCGKDCQPCPAGLQCCHGMCIDSQLQECCRDHPSNGVPVCNRPDACCWRDDGWPHCC